MPAELAEAERSQVTGDSASCTGAAGGIAGRQRDLGKLGGTVAGRYLYVAKNNNQAGLVHTPLPHGEAKKVAAGLNADSLLAIKPGMEVSVRIAVAMTQQEQQQIYDALVKKLTENGYLEQTRSPHDRRSVTVRLSEKGRGLAAALSELYGRHIALLEERVLKESELQQANEVLMRLERFWAGSLGYAWRVSGPVASDAA